jgi:hypothetical protein
MGQLAKTEAIVAIEHVVSRLYVFRYVSFVAKGDGYPVAFDANGADFAFHVRRREYERGIKDQVAFARFDARILSLLIRSATSTPKRFMKPLTGTCRASTLAA